MSIRRFRIKLSTAVILLLCGFDAAVGQLPLGRPESKTKIIVIDAGHGGSADAGSDLDKNKSTSNNATTPIHRILEKDITLELSLLIAARIKESDAAKSKLVDVVLTRASDENLSFTRRAAKALNAACFAAIHFNAANGKAHGPRGIIQQEAKNPNFSRDKRFALALAGAVQEVTTKYLKTPNASWHDDRELHAGFGSYLFYQLNQHAQTRLIPACHLEVEFIDNPQIEELLFVSKRHEVFQAWAQAIAAALIKEVLLEL